VKERNRNDNYRGTLAGLGVGISLGAALGIALDNLAVGIGFGFMIGLALRFVIRRTNAKLEYPAGTRIQLVIALVIFMVSIIGAMLLFQLEMQDWLLTTIALATTLPSLFLAYTLGKAITSLDELQRRIQTESIAISFGGTFVVATTYGLLGLVGVPQLNWLYVAIVMGVLWALGKFWTMWKYR
jgi:hypothetical protein